VAPLSSPPCPASITTVYVLFKLNAALLLIASFGVDLPVILSVTFSRIVSTEIVLAVF